MFVFTAVSLQPAPEDHFHLGLIFIALIILGIAILIITVTNIIKAIKIFFKKKPDNYNGFKIGDWVNRTTLNKDLTAYVHDKVRIEMFGYNDTKDIYYIMFNGDNQVYRTRNLHLTKAHCSTKSKLPKWW